MRFYDLLGKFQASGLVIGCPSPMGWGNSRLLGFGLATPYDVSRFPGLRGIPNCQYLLEANFKPLRAQ